MIILSIFKQRGRECEDAVTLQMPRRMRRRSPFVATGQRRRRRRECVTFVAPDEMVVKSASASSERERSR
jgi:hypothetical protein